MIIINRKKIPSNEVFPTIEDFINFLKKEYNIINFKNEFIQSSIESIYDILLKTDHCVPFLRLTKWLPSKFGFKYSNKRTLNFWIERGFSEDDYKKNNEIFFLNNKERLIRHIESSKVESYRYDPLFSNTYLFKTIYFESDVKPTCKLCKSDLLLKKSNKNDKKIYIIERCLNNECETQKSDRFTKWKAFLPKEKYEEIRKKLKSAKRAFSKEFWIKKGYTEEDAIKKVSEIQSNNSKKFKGKRTGKSKEVLRKKGYTDEQIREVSLTPSNIDFWIKKGFSESESKNIISINQSNFAKLVDFDKRLLPSNVEYWIKKGYSLEESKEKVSKSQRTFSREICIDKWGYEKGMEVFNNRTNKWQKSLFDNGNIKGGYSKVSQDLFFEIQKRLEGNFKFAKSNGELCIREDSNNYYYDFTDINRKKIIEYNGDQYHANPNKYNENDTPHPYYKCVGFSAKDIWEKDRFKIELANKNGYEVLTVWDSDYKNNKDFTIEKCINFLLDNR